ncbi:autotransporter domain-containing protein [Haemophilus influenzae]|uniref:S6 family peptidase n=1 Tax=Haemophilus influenzae TaxID=727 RepID=UPI000D02099E|nr:S6 family peptidase [Haemophilus influenzae]PRM67488.1 IgA-specific serine endopeptidase autotransporter precursor [Haemophilus influenzae]TWU95050.1 autotransporter domain-containing protein [Haemophilus influenzae]
MLNKKFKLSLITLSVIYALTPYTEAALVRDDVDYQIFRDFAENKGKFFVGATDLSVKNKQGQNIGNALSNVPMIDFSVADVNKRIATVVDPQYAVSVKHAKAEVHTFYYGQYNGHNDVADKENEYRVVEQNNYEPHKAWGASNLGRLEDYNMARFNKFVTEVAPIAPTDAGGGLDTYKDKNRFSSFVRVGAGRQLVYEKGAYHQEGNEKGYDLRDLSQAYRYAIAGTPYKDINIDQTMNTEGLIGFGHHNTHYSAEELKQALSQDALTNYGVLGDSGSPLFAFDKQKNQWVFLGTYDYWAGYGKKSWQEWNIYKKEFADKIKQHDNAGTIKGNGEHHWKTTGTNSHIGSTAVRLANNERDANNGQNVTFEDNGTLVLDQNINQGAGGLFFKGDYTVKGANSDITWLGAGIDVADGKKVVWQVKNPQGDKLAKIGKGALEINGTGVNQGELKVGDGTVILNQKADSNQKVQAFSQVGIVSGRGTLVLNSPDQINPNNLYFGFRGGRLDANGNDLTFEHIRNVDEGARVVNHNTSNASTITLTGKSLITDPKGLSIHYIQNNDYDDDGYYGYYYRPRKPIPQGKDLYFKNYRYYALKPGGSVNSPMPENGVAENNDWVFMGYTEEKAKKNVMNHKNNQRISGFSGFFGEENGKGHNGALNLNFNGKSAQNRFLLTGGTNLNGKISVTQGNVLLSGRPTPHARDFVNKSSAYKDAHFSKNNEVVFEDDWINRTFKAAEITVNQSASLSSGRNVSNITANITATDNAKVNLGYKNGDEVCVRSDYTGYVTCTKDNLSDKALNSFDATQINGNVNLSQNAALTLGKAALWGQIQGQGNSRVSLNQHSKWHLTGDSQVQNLSLEDSHIHLNNASDAQSANKYHTLKINHLSGNGHFHYLTHLAKNLGDKVVVKESASGHYQLHVQDKTGEPNQEGLDLFDASSVQDRSRLSVSLANHHVDLGALRYTIKTENGITRLYNPYAENRRRVKPVPSPATNTASQAQKATQTDGAQIAKPQNIVIAPPSPQANQAEEAKRQQAEAEKVARRKAEEAKRQAAELLAKQKAEAEAQALAARRQAEAERKARELAEREKAEAERKAAELAKQKAEQAKAQPKRRRRRAAPQNNVAIAQAQEARRQQAEAERVARLKAEEAKRQSEMLARQKSEEERKARELAEREKAEAERKAEELAKQKAEEASHQAKVQPKRRRRRAILPRPPAPVFSLDDYDAKDNSESSIGNLARVTPRMKRELIDDFEEIPLSALEEAETTTNITDNIGKDIQEILDDEFENTDIEPLIDSLGQVVRLQPRTLSPMENMSQAQAISKNTNTALSDAMVSSQFILLDTGSSLVQQITQTELSANKENNVWVSNTTYDRHYSSTQYRQFSAKRSQIQIGIDHYLSKNTQVGTVLSYVRNSNVFDQASGKNTFVQANTYGKYYFDYGWYISGDIGVGQLRSQLQTQQKAKFNRIATQAGIMIGNRIDINRFEILPSIGVRYSYLSSIDYKLGSDSLKVDSISIKTALAKLDLAYQFNIGEFALKPILSMAYVINSGEGIVNIGGQNYRYKSDNQQQYSAGMALNYRSLTFNINGGAIKGRQLSNQKFLQIKMQVSF